MEPNTISPIWSEISYNSCEGSRSPKEGEEARGVVVVVVVAVVCAGDEEAEEEERRRRIPWQMANGKWQTALAIKHQSN
jgi:hypothetical protein